MTQPVYMILSTRQVGERRGINSITETCMLLEELIICEK